MLNSAIAVAALVALVAPGFLVSRMAGGGRAAVASIGDLELVVRALTFSVLIQLPLFASGWTGDLVADIDHGSWPDHRFELVCFIAATYALTLVVGAALAWVFPRLEPKDGEGWRFLFHALGGQDARDAFDYLFLSRQGERFMVIVRTDPRGPENEDRHAGVWGSRSYFGLSPRPHDLLLQEMWKFDSDDNLVRLEPLHEGWFSADSIKDLYLRPLPEADDRAGITAGFGSAALRVAIYESRREVAQRMMVHRASARDGGSYEELERLGTTVAAAGADPQEPVDALRTQIMELGGLALELMTPIGEAEHNAASEAGRAGDYPPPWDLWAQMIRFYADRASAEGREDATSPGATVVLLRLAALCINAVIQIDETRDEA